MSMIAKKVIELPESVELSVNGKEISTKGPKGTLVLNLHHSVDIKREGDTIGLFPLDDRQSSVMRSILASMVEGVVNGFEKKLQLVGVGYRAQAQGNQLNLTLGFSHPVNYLVPEGVEVETPTPTEIFVRGCDKQKVGQVSAEIRAFRPPEPYKGKGVKYAGEQIVRKEAKKK